MKKNKIIFWGIWLGLLSLGFYTISKTVVVSPLNLLQRVSGVFVFTLLFIQIILGAYMDKLTSKFGSWIFKVHAIQGPVIYLLAVIHPFFLLLFNFKLFHTLDPFYIYTQVCFLCKNKLELFYTFGRLGLWLLTIGFFAAMFKNSNGWMKRNWKKLHIINYVVFFFVAIHAQFVGSDFRLFPLKVFYWLSIAAVFLTVLRKVLPAKEKE